MTTGSEGCWRVALSEEPSFQMIGRIFSNRFAQQYSKTRRNIVVGLHSVNGRHKALRIVLVRRSNRVLQKDKTVSAFHVEAIDGDG